MLFIKSDHNKIITIGSDPELFLVDKSGNFVSAIGKIPGTKNLPYPVPKFGRGSALQVDNVLVEYNTAPTTDLGTWATLHTGMLEHIKDRVSEFNLLPKIVAAAEMPESELMDPAACVFGCDPDYNAWELQPNPTPRSNNPRLRSAGGHIHIGVEGMTELEKINTTRAMDLLVGAYSVVHDPDTKRAELYGRPGAMRPKPYGIEYRTVSNFWLTDSGHMENVFSFAQTAAKYNSRSFQHLKEKVYSMFRNRDKELAKQLAAENFGVGL